MVEDNTKTVVDPRFLTPTPIIDSDSPSIERHAAAVTAGCTDPVTVSVALYYAVRDGIRYDPYVPFYRPEHFRASRVLAAGRGFCVSKAGLLCALARAMAIPSRVGFATVRNHLASRQLIDRMGTDRFVYHGYTEFFIEGRWVKATPAFNADLCRRHQVSPLEFDGRSDSLFQPYNLEKRRFMEYLEELGTCDDIPVTQLVAAWEAAYGRDRVDRWIAEMEAKRGRCERDFYREDRFTP